MPEQATAFEATRENFAQLRRRDPEWRSGFPRRALLVLLYLLGPDDERSDCYRQLMFDH
jgi:thioredoxin-like negative regulator of GroEL